MSTDLVTPRNDQRSTKARKQQTVNTNKPEKNMNRNRTKQQSFTGKEKTKRQGTTLGRELHLWQMKGEHKKRNEKNMRNIVKRMWEKWITVWERDSIWNRVIHRSDHDQEYHNGWGELSKLRDSGSLFIVRDCRYASKTCKSIILSRINTYVLSIAAIADYEEAPTHNYHRTIWWKSTTPSRLIDSRLRVVFGTLPMRYERIHGKRHD